MEENNLSRGKLKNLVMKKENIKADFIFYQLQMLLEILNCVKN